MWRSKPKDYVESLTSSSAPPLYQPIHHVSRVPHRSCIILSYPLLLIVPSVLTFWLRSAVQSISVQYQSWNSSQQLHTHSHSRSRHLALAVHSSQCNKPRPSRHPIFLTRSAPSGLPFTCLFVCILLNFKSRCLSSLSRSCPWSAPPCPLSVRTSASPPSGPPSALSPQRLRPTSVPLSSPAAPSQPARQQRWPQSLPSSLNRYKGCRLCRYFNVRIYLFGENCETTLTHGFCLFRVSNTVPTFIFKTTVA